MLFDKTVNSLLERSISEILTVDQEESNKGNTIRPVTQSYNQAEQLNKLKQIISQYNLQYRTTPRNLIVNTWIELGMGKDQANKLVQDSLSKLPNVGNLDKSIRVTSADTLDNELTVKMFLTLLSVDDKPLSVFTDGIWRNLLKYAKENNIDIKDRDYNQLLNLTKTNTEILEYIESYRQIFVNSVISAGKENNAIGGVISAGGSLILLFPQKIKSVNQFMDTLAHEALHTVQNPQVTNLYSPKMLTGYNKEDYDYYFNQHETQAWAGMIKRFYYSKTGIILDNNNLDKKYNGFVEFFNNYKSNEPSENNIINAIHMFIRQNKENPTGFKFKEILRDVAMNNKDSKNRVA
jgi:hypothetical protein